MRLMALGLALLLQACSNAAPPPCPYTGEPENAPSAGCLVLVHGRILLVENLRGRVSPPGGLSRAGESAQCSARSIKGKGTSAADDLCNIEQIAQHAKLTELLWHDTPCAIL